MNAKMVAAGLLVALTGLSAGADERSGGGIFHRDCECYLDTGWRFRRFDNAESEPNGAESPAFDASSWRSVRLPHDWGVEKPFRKDIHGIVGKLEFFGVGWYKTSFRVPKKHT